MSRRLMLGLLLGLPRPSLSQPSPDLHARIVAFERVWYPFLQTLYGCNRASPDLTPDNCRPARGTFDWKGWEASVKAASRLFSLGTLK